MRTRSLAISGLLALVAIVAAVALSHPCDLAPTPPSPEPQDGTGDDDTAGPVDPDGGSSG